MKNAKLKICGMKYNTSEVSNLAPDYLGFIFYEKSPRAVTIASANLLLAEAAPFVTVTGLFMNADRDRVSAVLREVKLNLLQFHGDETAEYCGGFDRPYIKAIPMGEQHSSQNFTEGYARAHPDAIGFLLDSNAVGSAGGSGETFDWLKVSKLGKYLVLAGGINGQNVADAIRTVRPYAIDVSSGIEKERGVKDHNMMKQFVQEVRLVDQEC